MMVGGNQAKSTTNKPPASSTPTAAASSSSHDQKSRLVSSNNDGGTNKNSNNNNNKPTMGGQKIADKKLPKPNPSPKLAPMPNQSNPNHPNPKPSSSRPLPGSVMPAAPPFPFPDSAAALGPPPPPTYGFHMLERRTIALVDGSIRSYFALPPNYQDFPPQSRLVDPAANRFMGPEFGRFPPFHPEEFRDQRQHWDRPEGSMKRKYPGEEESDRRDERGEMMRQRQQFMQYANPRDPSLMAGTSSQFGEDVRAAKHMRIGSSRHESNGQALKHLQVDQVALKKYFLGFVKRIYEDLSERKKYLENGRKGRLQCLVCGRFDGFQSVSCVCLLLRFSLLVLDTLVTLFLMVALIGLMFLRRLNEHEESTKEH